MTGGAAAVAVVAVAGLGSWCAYRWGCATGQARPSVPEIRQAILDLHDFYDESAAAEARASRRPSVRMARKVAQSEAMATLLSFVDGDPEPVERARKAAAAYKGSSYRRRSPGGR